MDKQLAALKITLTTQDEFNHSSNAVVEHGCAELENKIHQLTPASGTISQAQLTQATVSLN